MKSLTLLSGLTVACGCLLPLSCSKALTDVGYEPGPFDTSIGYQPFMEGSASRIIPSSLLDFGPEVYEEAILYLHSPNIVNTNMGGIDKKLFDETAKKQCVRYARKFYTTLLSPKFQAEKFSKKYRSSCLRMLNEAIDSAATTNDHYKGWQIFTDGSLKPNTAVSVTYIGGAWFKVSQASNPGACVYVLMIVPSVKRNPKIVGIKYQSGQIIPEGV